MLTMFVIFFSVIALVIAYVIWDGNKRSAIAASLHQAPNFTASETLICSNKALAVDHVSQKIAVTLDNSGAIKTRVFPYSALTGVELEIAGGSSYTQVTGFGKATTQDRIQSITLAVTFADKDLPLLRIPIYSPIDNKPSAAGEFLERDGVQRANIWKGLLSAIVRARTVDSEIPIELLKETSAPAISAEIQSLKKLHSDGTLTDEEFAAAKARVLQMPNQQPDA